MAKRIQERDESGYLIEPDWREPEPPEPPDYDWREPEPPDPPDYDPREPEPTDAPDYPEPFDPFAEDPPDLSADAVRFQEWIEKNDAALGPDYSDAAILAALVKLDFSNDAAALAFAEVYIAPPTAAKTEADAARFMLARVRMAHRVAKYITYAICGSSEAPWMKLETFEKLMSDENHAVMPRRARIVEAIEDAIKNPVEQNDPLIENLSEEEIHTLWEARAGNLIVKLAAYDKKFANLDRKHVAPILSNQYVASAKAARLCCMSGVFGAVKNNESFKSQRKSFYEAIAKHGRPGEVPSKRRRRSDPPPSETPPSPPRSDPSATE